MRNNEAASNEKLRDGIECKATKRHRMINNNEAIQLRILLQGEIEGMPNARTPVLKSVRSTQLQGGLKIQ
jgi:hypothetical protein